MLRNGDLITVVRLLERAERCAVIADQFGVMGNRRLSVQWARKADGFWLAWTEAMEAIW